ncbi:MAG: calcium-translocating P-type ATPase, PMCA-type [Kiritimatiellae bacterium]|nr:calcium-translocating P-type ATPase, PMCA-type [Kiritimatiellia bacterium]
MKPFYCESSDAVLERLGVNPRQGVSGDEVQQRRTQYGENVLSRAKPVSLWQRIGAVLCEPMTLLLLLAVGVLVTVNVIHGITGGETDFAECVGVLIAIVLSVGISVVMEGRSAKAFEALRAIGADVLPTVLRDGKRIRLPQAELVVGDIVFVGTGDKVMADGRLLEAHGLLADESALTGESAAVQKEAQAAIPPEAPVAERVTMLYAGSFLTAGSGKMVVTAVGMQTEFGKIASALAGQEQAQTPLQARLAQLGKWVTMAGAIAAGIAFLARMLQAFCSDVLTWTAVGDAFISAIVLVVACVPEGLPTIVAMSLAVNVLRMAKQQALVKRMVASETIGCVTFICSDKTGTLTENRMTVMAFVSAAGEESTPSGAWLQNICVNATADLKADGSGFTGNPTEGALLVAVAKAGINPKSLRDATTIRDVEPFSSETKCMITHVAGASPLALMKGSPERVLADCLPEVATAAAAAMAPWQERACRVLAFAHRSPTDDVWTYDGFAAIADPVRAEVPEALAACRSAGIDVMMLTGDNLLTAQAIAKQVQILSGDKRAVTAAELEALNDTAFAEALKTVRVIARSTPSIKLRVVQTLRARGETVAVTGDGINDAPAIKAADVGVAMGITGTEVTKEACDILLLDDAFSTIVRAIRWGRGIADGFKRFILFQLTVNVSSVLVVLIAALAGLASPFTALWLLWVNLIMDGPPALCLGLEPLGDDLLKRAPVRRDAPLITPAMAWRMGITGIVIALLSLCQLRWDFLGAGPEAAQTALFSLFVFCQLANALSARKPEGGNPLQGLLGNPALIVALIVTATLQWVIVTFGGSVFKTVPLPAEVWGKCLFIAACIPLLGALLPHSAEDDNR